MDKKTFSVGFVIFFIVLTIYLNMNDQSVAQTIANDGINGVVWYVLSNPAYILLFISIYMLNSEVNFIRNTLGASMIIYASDIISFPRLLSGTTMPTDISILASSDGLVITKIMHAGYSYPSAHFFYYTILPIALVLGALAILGIHNFFKQLVPNHG